MKKRLLSLLLAVTMLLSVGSGLSVFAETVTYENLVGWFFMVTGDSTISLLQNADTYINIAEGEGVGYNSNRAMYVNWTDDTSAVLVKNIGQFASGGTTYNVSYRIKLLNDKTMYPTIVFGYDDAGQQLSESNMTIGEPDADGWRLVTGTTTTNATREFRLQIGGGVMECYIDDFVVNAT